MKFNSHNDLFCDISVPLRKCSLSFEEAHYSHSMVAGGFELTSYTTRLIPLTSLIIRLLTSDKKSYGRCDQSAVMPSTLLTDLKAIVYSYVLSSPITPTDCTGSRTASACQTLSYRPWLRSACIKI